MKRLIGVMLAVTLLTGAAFTTDLLASRMPGSKVQARSAPPVGALVNSVQIYGFPLPESISIMLSSLILLGGTTLLRRYRT